MDRRDVIEADATFASGSFTEDHLLDGKLRLRQPAGGHRAGTDAILLAAAAGELEKGLVVDVGSGVGTAGLAVALRCAGARLALVENDPSVARLAQENLRLNGLAEHGFVAFADVTIPGQRRAAGLIDGSAALVLTNPPFFAPGRVRVSPAPGRRRAHLMATTEDGDAISLADWMRASLALLAPDGAFVMIHRPEALAASLAAAEGRLGDLRVLPVHSRRGAPATRILFAGRKGSRAPLSLLSGFVLHEEDGTFTADAEAIHRGAMLLSV